ncbi:hypothetical protein SAMN04488563_3688 [Jiangella alkaliphila]|uniref:Uncharacterized protein n=1 Tax=Jiangella alkaliphila TaxID=419479 RepID=A0A1H2KDK4_9ACTN|nr:hypothetical protein SAMN04488563_3688 [Jiangella alkaliphila]
MGYPAGCDSGSLCGPSKERMHVNHSDRDERTVLARLRQLRQHTEVIGQILRDLWPVIAGAFSILGVALHQFVTLLR